MSDQTISRQAPLADELTSEIPDAQHHRRNGAAHREPPRPRSTVRPRPTYPETEPMPQPSYHLRPRGHVVGHGIGDPPALSSAGRPRGHVVGHGVGNAHLRQLSATYRKA